MAHTTVNSGFWSGGLQELTPLDGSTNHGARLRKAVAPEVVHEPELDGSVETPLVAEHRADLEQEKPAAKKRASKKD